MTMKEKQIVEVFSRRAWYVLEPLFEAKKVNSTPLSQQRTYQPLIVVFNYLKYLFRKLRCGLEVNEKERFLLALKYEDLHQIRVSRVEEIVELYYGRVPFVENIKLRE